MTENTDKIAPTLSSAIPKANGSAVKVNQNVILKFNEAVKAGSGNIVISDGKDSHSISITDKSQIKISGNTLTLNPTDNLLPNSTYSVKISASAIKDLAGNKFAGILNKTALSFNTVDTLSPQLDALTAKNLSAPMAVDKNIVLTFNETVKAGAGIFVISNGSDTRKIAITDNSQVTFDGKIVTLNPTKDLQGNGHYNVTFRNTVVKDLAGNKFAGISDKTALSFNTADNVAPQFDALTAKNLSAPMASDKNLVLIFNEAIQAGSGNIVISNGTDIRTISITDKTQVTVTDKTVTINPTVDLNFSSNYSIKLAAGTLKDLAGNSFAGNETSALLFTTVAKPIVIDVVKPVVPVVVPVVPVVIEIDKIAPTLTSSSPTDNGVNVLIGANLVLTFNETIKAGSGNIIISNGTDIRTISIADKTQITVTDKTVTINPTADLLAGSHYSVQFAAGVITDNAGNPFAGLTNATTFNFSTAAANFVPVLTSGKAVDGYLSGSDVFADANGDGVWNEGEAKATTDASGNFTLSGAKGVINISGGTDLSTGKAFQGVMKAPEGSTVVTPFTNLQQGFIDAGQTLAQAEKSVATAFGFDADKVDLTKYDPIAELVKAVASGTTDAVATQMMASSAKIANFFVAAGQVLQGAAGGSDNVSTQNVGDALLKSLVVSIQNDAKTGDGEIDLGDAKLLKTVIVDGAKEVNTHAEKVAKETGSTAAPKFDAAQFTDKIDKMADTVTAVLKTAADNITAAVSKGGDGLTLLSNMDKVSAFTQNDAGKSLSDVAKTLDTKNAAGLDAALKGQTDLFTGDKATKATEAKVVETKKAVNDVIASDKVISDKVISDKVASDKVISDKVASDKVISDKVASDKVISDKVASDKVISDKVASDKVISDKVASDKVASDKVISDKVASDKVISDKVASDKVISDKVASDKVISDAAAASSGSDTGDTTSAPATVTINADGSKNASTGKITFDIAAGNYVFTIVDFANGDTLHFPAGQAPSVTNENLTDGKVELHWAADGQEVVISLTGLTVEQDKALLFDSSFNAVFGVNALN